MAEQTFDLVLAPQTVRVRLETGVVHNVLTSLHLIDEKDHDPGISNWIYETASAMTPEQQQRNRLVMSVLPCATDNDNRKDWNSFPAYVDDLARRNPTEIVQMATAWLPERERLLGDVEAYVAFLRQKYAHKGADHEFHEEHYRELHRLLNEPETLHAMAVAHLREMWDQFFAAEWQRHLPMLQESINAFQQLDYSGLTALEAIRLVTGRDLSGKWEEHLANLSEIIFVPSPHIGPYVMLFTGDTNLGRVMFGARLPAGMKSTSTALGRSDLLVRLSALADDTRLQILELLTRHDELCAQDIINMLDLSQSSASRHLRQLSATGYLLERRREVSKCYSLNPERVHDTVAALKMFLQKK